MLLSIALKGYSQEETEFLLTVKYHSLNNRIPYLTVTTAQKSGKKIQPAQNAIVSLYLNEPTQEGLLGEVKTNLKGVAKLVIPPAAKQAWDSSKNYKFIGVWKEEKNHAEITSEIEMTKTMVTIDTTRNGEGVKALAIKVTSYESGEWVPAPEVEMTVGVKRLGSLLPIGDEETYTTDSTGQVIADFIKDSLPTLSPDNNIVVAVKVDDNELFGNLLIEKTIPWGKTIVPVNQMGRSLWATADKSPYWLLFMSGFTFLAVWSVLAFLIWQIVRLKKAAGSI